MIKLLFTAGLVYLAYQFFFRTRQKPEALENQGQQPLTNPNPDDEYIDYEEID